MNVFLHLKSVSSIFKYKIAKNKEYGKQIVKVLKIWTENIEHILTYIGGTHNSTAGTMRSDVEYE